MNEPMSARLRLTKVAIAFLPFALASLPSQSMEYRETCYFQGSSRNCNVSTGHVKPLRPGSDVEIYWEDGQVTTVKWIFEDPLRAGERVLINGQTTGRIADSAYSRGVNYIAILSASGNTVSFSFGD